MTHVTIQTFSFAHITVTIDTAHYEFSNFQQANTNKMCLGLGLIRITIGLCNGPCVLEFWIIIEI